MSNTFKEKLKNALIQKLTPYLKVRFDELKIVFLDAIELLL
jgi:hypothetical protein